LGISREKERRGRAGLVVAPCSGSADWGRACDIQLDCKLPSPGHPELAMSAISEGRGIVWNEDVRKKNIKRGLEQSPKA